MSQRTMRGDRLHLAFFGRRNAGKSSLINALTGQPVAIVSDTPGTTTDPVYKSMELLPLGPVVLIDTAGMDDDAGLLGAQRIERSRQVMSRTDLALLTVPCDAGDLSYEEGLLRELEGADIPILLVLTKVDLPLSEPLRQWLSGRVFVRVSALGGQGVAELRQRIQEVAPRHWEPEFLKDLIQPGEVVVLVTPIDLGAPKGRLIMPQVKALRDVLDGDGIPVMCKERELPGALAALKDPPRLVVTDSQVFPQVAADVPPGILLTSFSILSARQKGDLPALVEGARVLDSLRPGDRVLIAEACSHHPLEDDIGRVKIPRWLDAHVGGGLDIRTVPGCAFPPDLESYKLVVHCGGCTLNRREMLHRQGVARSHGVPMTNYGVLIAWLKGVFPRALQPFPELYRLWAGVRSLGGTSRRRILARHTD